MKICEFTEHELTDWACKKAGKFIVIATPLERAMLMLNAALESVNQAGLDGKKLSNLTIVTRRDDPLSDLVYEVHAKVTHRLKTA